MTHNKLIIAECAARQRGDHKEADQLQALRWKQAMGTIVNSVNTKPKSHG